MDETKECRYCKTQIPKAAKICPNCRKKQGKGFVKWIVIAIAALFVIAMAAGGSGEDKDKNPQKISTSSAASTETAATTETQEESNVFEEGDTLETEDFRITFVKTGEYESDNEFLQPKDGYVYWQFEFSFENISDTDQTVSSLMDWECYADNSNVDRAWIGDDNGLDATLSAGRTTQGTIYYEVPKDAKSIELEYNISYWNSNKIVFIGK